MIVNDDGIGPQGPQKAVCVSQPGPKHLDLGDLVERAPERFAEQLDAADKHDERLLARVLGRFGAHASTPAVRAMSSCPKADR